MSVFNLLHPGLYTHFSVDKLQYLRKCFNMECTYSCTFWWKNKKQNLTVCILLYYLNSTAQELALWHGIWHGRAWLRASRVACVSNTLLTAPLQPPASQPCVLTNSGFPAICRTLCRRRASCICKSGFRHVRVLTHCHLVTCRKEMTPILSDFLCDNTAAGCSAALSLMV